MSILPSNAVSCDSVAYLNGDWIAKSDMRIDVDDLGFRQAVTIVERLRTYDGKPFLLPRHLKRFAGSCDYLSIAPIAGRDTITHLIDQLLDRNSDLTGHGVDVGITMFATPGTSLGKTPTFGLHINLLNKDLNQQRILSGQAVVITDIRQPENESWSRSIKTRCRLHYYRADTIASAAQDGATGVLVDTDGTVTESSIANLAIVTDGQIVSPESDQVLGGITQSFVEELAEAEKLRWIKQRITPQRLIAAGEVMLMGTDAGLWFANRVDQTAIGDGDPGPIYRRLRAAFDQRCPAAG